ncbi:MAG: amino acid ABC transporter ATP-binding protein, partial [Bilophila sp.]
NNVSLNVLPGELKVLIGPSGAGKSTFLQCLNYLIPPDSGEIWLEGHKVQAQNTRALCAFRQQVGMIFQDFNLFDHLSAEENVSIALRKVAGYSRADARERALNELGRVGLAKRAALYPAQLSGGQKQRVAIARALAMDPKVMLLDEPTSALDPELVGEVLAVIRDLADGGMTMIMATHQMDFARALATEILFMEQGKIIEQGAPATLLAPGSGTRTSDFCGKLLDIRAPQTPVSDGDETSEEPVLVEESISDLLRGDLSHDLGDNANAAATEGQKATTTTSTTKEV